MLNAIEKRSAGAIEQVLKLGGSAIAPSADCTLFHAAAEIGDVDIIAFKSEKPMSILQDY